MTEPKEPNIGELRAKLELAEAGCAAYRGFIVSEMQFEGLRAEFGITTDSPATERNFRMLSEWLEKNKHPGKEFCDRLSASLADRDRLAKELTDTQAELSAAKEVVGTYHQLLVKLQGLPVEKDDEGVWRKWYDVGSPLDLAVDREAALAAPHQAKAEGEKPQ